MDSLLLILIIFNDFVRTSITPRVQKLVLFAALSYSRHSWQSKPGQNDMAERPSDKFLSREKAYELEHKTGFSRKELLTFHKHYGAH